MQCYTFKNKYPRTTTGRDFPWYPDSVFPNLYEVQTSLADKLTPDRAARKHAPNTVPHRPFINRPELRYDPQLEVYRAKRLPMMLEHINKVNWSTSQQACVSTTRRACCVGGRKDGRTLPVPTHRHHFRDWGWQPLEQNQRPRDAALGAVPGVYSAIPYGGGDLSEGQQRYEDDTTLSLSTKQNVRKTGFAPIKRTHGRKSKF